MQVLGSSLPSGKVLRYDTCLLIIIIVRMFMLPCYCNTSEWRRLQNRQVNLMLFLKVESIIMLTTTIQNSSRCRWPIIPASSLLHCWAKSFIFFVFLPPTQSTQTALYIHLCFLFSFFAFSFSFNFFSNKLAH